MIKLIKKVFQFLFCKKQKVVNNQTTIDDNVEEAIDLNLSNLIPAHEEKLELEINDDIIPGYKPEVIELKLNTDIIPATEPSQELKLEILGSVTIEVDKLNIKRANKEDQHNIYYVKNLIDGSYRDFPNTFKVAKYLNVHPKTLQKHLKEKYSDVNKGRNLNKITFRQNYIITKERK